MCRQVSRLVAEGKEAFTSHQVLCFTALCTLHSSTLSLRHAASTLDSCNMRICSWQVSVARAQCTMAGTCE